MASISPVHPMLKATTWVQTSDKDFTNGTLKNLTIIGNGDDAELIIDLTNLHTWTKKTPQKNPIGREGHAMASILGADKTLLFGGINPGHGWFNDTWEYDLSENKWSEKKPIIAPSDRYGHAMSSIYKTNKVMLFGGWDNITNSNDDETWIYNMSTSSWNQQFLVEKPDPRFEHAMAPIWGTSNVLLFGGFTNIGINDETWIYNYTNNTWTLKSMTNKPGAGGRYAMASIYGDDKVVLFRGQGNVGETWIYDFSNNSWVQKIPNNNPSPRSMHAMATIWGTDKIVMFGGVYTSIKGDTWFYDVGDNKWSKISFSGNKPSARRDHAIATVYGTSKVVLFGGDSNKNLNDTWIYSHFTSTKNGTYVSYPYDTGANSTFNILSWYANLPINTSIHLQLRSATNLSLLFNRSFVGPNGKNDTYYSISPTSIWPGHNGDQWIQYMAFLNISELTDSPILKEVTIIYNCIPTTIVISPINKSIINDNKPNFAWTFDDFDSEQQKAFQLLIDNDINFENIEYDSGEQQSSQQQWEFSMGTNYTIIPDGVWYWKVRTKDDDGTWSMYSSTLKLIIDTNIPTSLVTVPNNNKYYKNIKIISGIVNEGSISSGLNKVEILIKRLNDNFFWDGQNWSFIKKWLLATGTNNWTYDSNNIEWTSSVSYSIQSRAIDNATNIEISNNYIIFTIDRESPISIIDNPQDNQLVNKNIIISGTSIDFGGVGVDKIEICIKCVKDASVWDEFANLNDYWAGDKWKPTGSWLPVMGIEQWSFNTSSIQWSTGDQYLIRSRAIDNLENVEVPSIGIIFSFDDSPPDSLSIYINNGEDYTQTNDVNLSLHAEDLGSGCAQMAFSVDGFNWSNWEIYNISRAFELPWGDAEKKIYFRVRDYAYNIAESIFDTIIFDSTPPQELSITINDDAKYTNSDIVTLTLYGSDSLSGLSDMSFSFDDQSWTSWESFRNIQTISLTPGDDDKIIYFRIRDKASNIAQVYDTIIYDSTPPYSLSISINNDAIETKTTVVEIDINAKDNKSGIDKISFSENGKLWDSWQNYTGLVYYELPAGDGLKTLYFRARDRAGNIAKPISGTILLNTTNPKIDNDKPTNSGPAVFNMWIILLIVVIIAIILFIALIAVLKKRKKLTEQELLAPGTFAIKPGTLPAPVIALDQVPAAPSVAQLQGTTVSSSPQQLTVSVPQLAKSTQIVQPTISQPMTQSVVQPSLPQLPPAQVQVASTETIETTQPSVATSSPTPTPTIAPSTQIPKPTIDTTQTPTTTSVSPTPATSQTTPVPTPTTTPIPSISQLEPQGSSTPKITPTPSIPSGPEIHLPDSTPRPTLDTSTQPTPTVTNSQSQQPSTSDESIEDNNSQTKPRTSPNKNLESE